MTELKMRTQMILSEGFEPVALETIKSVLEQKNTQVNKDILERMDIDFYDIYTKGDQFTIHAKCKVFQYESKKIAKMLGGKEYVTVGKYMDDQGRWKEWIGR